MGEFEEAVRNQLGNAFDEIALKLEWGMNGIKNVEVSDNLFLFLGPEEFLIIPYTEIPTSAIFNSNEPLLSRVSIINIRKGHFWIRDETRKPVELEKATEIDLILYNV